MINNNTRDLVLYVGMALIGFFIPGFLAGLVMGISGIAGIVGIVGAVVAVIFTRKLKNARNKPPTTPRETRSTPVRRTTTTGSSPMDIGRFAQQRSTPKSTREAPSRPIIRLTTLCHQCGATSHDGATHCISCGNRLPVPICPKCEAENTAQAKFCMSCGEEM